MFHVGQMVVCIESFNDGLKLFGFTRLPKEKEVFTIREIYTDHTCNNRLGLCFEEILGPIHKTLKLECGFGAEYFRPVKITSIELFNEILLNVSNTTPIVEPVKEDA